jgi:hypothetical protein
MSTVLEIERAIEKLPRNDVFVIADWISKRFSDAWDAQIEEDVLTGALDHLVNGNYSGRRELASAFF